MFKPDTYIARRQKLKEQIGSGLILFLSNNESPMNYEDNAYHFRQDSTFLYYWGLNSPGLAAIIDIDADSEIIFGHDFTIDEIIWMGPQAKLREKAEKVGVKNTAPPGEVESAIKKAQKVHFLPQYRADNSVTIGGLLGVNPTQVNESASTELIKAVVGQRSIKSEEELAQIEIALDIAYEMHTYVMRNTKPGLLEQEISGAIEGLALAKGGRLSFPVIFSVDGQTLHNHYHGNIMKAGDIAVCDAGAESAMNYAADITRTTPVSGYFTDRQKAIYEIVLNSQLRAIEAIEPNKTFRDVHLIAAKEIASGLSNLGIMQGDVDEAVKAGAHAMFFPHGLGHMMGLDVHDMENFGEDFIGYDDEVQRSEQFGFASLRIGKKVQPGYVITVEPGIYFIPELIDIWKADKKLAEFINYDEVEKYRDFGGIRIEDNVVVTDAGCRVLGKPIPKTIAEVERMASG